MGKTAKALIPPYIINTYKPAGMSSQDIVRHFKRNLPLGFGKIGHFGTLDPFAEGVLMLGVAGAARLNELIHDELPKTYIACGKLGVDTETGDLTSEPSQIDQSDYFKNHLPQLTKEEIEKKLQKKFIGEYWQSPHKYSAAKFQGKSLHTWAREGVEVFKEKKRREIYQLNVLSFSYPYLTIEFQVSSGTYIRTLFSECAKVLDTLGALKTLVRSQVGHIHCEHSLKKEAWPEKGDQWSYQQQGVLKPWEVLNYNQCHICDDLASRFQNGNPIPLELEGEGKKAWVFSGKKILGLGEFKDDLYWPKIVWK